MPFLNKILFCHASITRIIKVNSPIMISIAKAAYANPASAIPISMIGAKITIQRIFVIVHVAFKQKINSFHAAQINAMTNIIVSMQSPLSLNQFHICSLTAQPHIYTGSKYFRADSVGSIILI